MYDQQDITLTFDTFEQDIQIVFFKPKKGIVIKIRNIFFKIKSY